MIRLPFRLAYAALATIILTGAVASAPISGMVGVGTWNTQAEYADVKVTNSSGTLYQSDFASGMAGWTTSGGIWQTVNGNLRQTGGSTPALAFVGSTSWSNYTLTLKARKLSGAEGFVILFGSPGNTTKSWWNIGGWGNTVHAIEMAGVSTPSVAGSVVTGRWYDIRVQVSGTDIRCYLDEVLIHDTARILDGTERAARFQQLTSSPGYSLLNTEERPRLQELAARSVFIGAAARATFDSMPSSLTFAGLTPWQQAVIIRKVNRNRLTWNLGWGYEGIDAGRKQTIIDSMDSAATLYNSLGLFEKHATANNSPGTPTADANYDGNIRFGGSYNARVAIHEMSHCMGAGTYYRWGELMVNGAWTGAYGNARVSALEGGSRVMYGDSIHFWPYGLNYDNEDSAENRRRNVLMVAAFRRDMGIHTFQQTVYSTDVPNGLYRLTPRHAPGMALDVLDGNPANGAQIDIANRLSSGAERQSFYIDRQADGTYRIRTALPGNRCLELPSGLTENGTKVRLWDNDGRLAQRWYLIPLDDGWYKIAPRNNVNKCFDVTGIASTPGTLIESWDFWDGTGQQWFLTQLAQAFSIDELVKTLAIAIGARQATTTDVSRFDIVNNTAPGVIDLMDAQAIARKVAGLDVNP